MSEKFSSEPGIGGFGYYGLDALADFALLQNLDRAPKPEIEKEKPSHLSQDQLAEDMGERMAPKEPTTTYSPDTLIG